LEELREPSQCGSESELVWLERALEDLNGCVRNGHPSVELAPGCIRIERLRIILVSLEIWKCSRGVCTLTNQSMAFCGSLYLAAASLRSSTRLGKIASKSAREVFAAMLLVFEECQM
jgi:hypothetical protein